MGSILQLLVITRILHVILVKIPRLIGLIFHLRNDLRGCCFFLQASESRWVLQAFQPCIAEVPFTWENLKVLVNKVWEEMSTAALFSQPGTLLAGILK